MPYKSFKKGKCYEVVNIEDRTKKAKCTTQPKAEAQIRLLNAVEHGFQPTKTTGSGAGMTYREFVKKHMADRPAGMKVTEYMKEIAKKWREHKGTKGAGETLLVEPGLGQTSANYVA